MNTHREQTLRLDLLLWYLRFARSRSLAKTMAQSGKLRCNGQRIVKGHHQMGVGDVLTLMHRGRVLVVRIEALPKRRGSAIEAAQHYSHMVDTDCVTVTADRENVSVST
ncbi:MAG: S4 domain-containing protein [Pseudomonadota bacterium]